MLDQYALQPLRCSLPSLLPGETRILLTLNTNPVEGFSNQISMLQLRRKSQTLAGGERPYCRLGASSVMNGVLRTSCVIKSSCRTKSRRERFILKPTSLGLSV